MPFFINCNPDVRSLDKNVVEQELEFAINLALYGVLCSLGSQYIDGNDSWTLSGDIPILAINWMWLSKMSRSPAEDNM